MRRKFLSIGEIMVELSQKGDGQLMQKFAGDSFNTIWYLRKLTDNDAWETNYFTALGQDPLSQKIFNFIEDAKIGTQFIIKDPKHNPGLYMIHLENGEREFQYWRANSAATHLADDVDLLDHAVNSNDVMYFSGISVAILGPTARSHLHKVLKHAKSLNKTIIFDPNMRLRLWDSAQSMTDTIVSFSKIADIIMPSFDDEQTYFGDADIEETAARYLSYGAQMVVVKNGAKGAIVQTSSGDNAAIFPDPIVNIIDTTSAGDSFNGGFLSAYLTHQPLTECLNFGAKIAAKVIQHQGALVNIDEFMC